MKGRYALRLCCAGCGKYLFGDVGRYRHPPPTCEGFLAAKPVVRCRRARNREGIDTRIKGHSYPQEWYEDAVGELLGKVGELDDAAMTEIVRLYGEGLAKPDELTLARIEREREEASQRLAKTRDVAAWQATMARLDAEQQVARQPRQQQRMAPDEVVAYLRSLPTLWNDAGPEGRQALASALFTKLEVEGYTKMRYATHTRCRYPRSRRSPTGAAGDRWSHRWVWSGREDLNLRPQRPERCALPNCATPRLKGPPRHRRSRGIGIIGHQGGGFACRSYRPPTGTA